MSSFVDLLKRRKTHFVLWRPGRTDPTPSLCFVALDPKSSDLKDRLYRYKDFAANPEFPDLWEISAKELELEDGHVIHYWYIVHNTEPYETDQFDKILYCTDPTATCVNRKEYPPQEGGIAKSSSIVLYKDGELVPCDPDGGAVHWDESDKPSDNLPTNNKLIIYEMPTRWSKIVYVRGEEVGKGTFRDAIAFCDVDEREKGLPDIINDRAHLVELGVNALELLPPEDHDDPLAWGYGTGNFFAPDYELGQHRSKCTPGVDLARLVEACHKAGFRFFTDVVMAFSRNNSYHNINFRDFYLEYDPNCSRDSFGGDLFAYDKFVDGYNPTTGKVEHFSPAREYMKVHIAHWMEHFRIDGIRLDSINNIDNYDFLQEFKEYTREIWRKRGGKDDRFLVVGEELMVPLEVVTQRRLDGLWNERFKHHLRKAILGRQIDGCESFEDTVKMMVDCRLMGFEDAAQAVIYITSHDVGGAGNERIYNYLVNNKVQDIEGRVKLAFVCLLTSVGIPLILAGDEFAEQHDKDCSRETPKSIRNKQTDPVHYERLHDEWRRRVFQYVSRLCHFRRKSESLTNNETTFLHCDYEEGKRVIVWQRGPSVVAPEDAPVIVVANFSNYATPQGSEYQIVNWPENPPGTKWIEITQERDVVPEQVSREAIYPWEAKVYTWVKC
eukprot:TRINITY_DN7368_c0_g1_i1.p1 TRINITY_DN7368_c0_g1~~TRINITY_DN7368_c0_g1_i1.p1  ORF type:complete len:689 (-),score=145.41 TRINITY_DN7368_c0_g1_i1:113-2113(-)